MQIYPTITFNQSFGFFLNANTCTNQTVYRYWAELFATHNFLGSPADSQTSRKAKER